MNPQTTNLTYDALDARFRPQALGTADYQHWVEAFARNHDIPIEWAEKGVRKEVYVEPWLRKMVRKNAYGVRRQVGQFRCVQALSAPSARRTCGRMSPLRFWL